MELAKENTEIFVAVYLVTGCSEMKTSGRCNMREALFNQYLKEKVNII
jgi:hypothetical protein